MKRYLVIITVLSLILCLSGTGCGRETPAAPSEDDVPVLAPDVQPEPEDPEPDTGGDRPRQPTGVKLGVLRDSAAIGAAGLAAEGLYDVRVGGADVMEDLSSGALDAAVIPVSDAARLYNETGGKVRIAAVTAAGGWVLVERGDSVQDIFGLVDRTVYLPTGYDAEARMFEHVASEYGYIIGDTLDVMYVGEDALESSDLALMPSLMAGRAIVRDSDARIALDLQELWTYLTEEPILPAGCLAVGESLGGEELETLLEDLHASQLNVSDHLDAAVDAGLAQDQEEAWAALEGCELTWIEGADELRESIAGYLRALYGLDPSLIGGFVPDDGFYR